MRSTSAAGSKPARQVSRKARAKGKPPALKPFRVTPHDFGFDPSLNLDKALALADELGDLEILQKLKKLRK